MTFSSHVIITENEALLEVQWEIDRADPWWLRALGLTTGSQNVIPGTSSISKYGECVSNADSQDPLQTH